MNKEEFINNLIKLNIELTNKQQEQLEQYYNLLVTENKKYNLTAITNKEDVYLKHFYDSLTISKVINLTNQEICDIGTGAGFPGLVLKIVYPNIKLTLVDATLKKCNFLNLVVNTLKLENVTIINSRIEEYAKEIREKYDIVTCRAVANLKILLELAIPLTKVNGYFIPLKGNIIKELDNIDTYKEKLNISLEKQETFLLPKENSQRTILVFNKNKETNLKYPRNYNEIIKKEL